MRQIMERKKKTVFRRLSAALLVLILCAAPSCGHGEDTARDPAAEQETVETAATAENEVGNQADAGETEPDAGAEGESAVTEDVEAAVEETEFESVYPKGIQAKSVVRITEPGSFSDKLTVASLQGLAAKHTDEQILIRTGAADLYAPVMDSVWGAELTNRIGGKPATFDNLLAGYRDRLPGGYVLCSAKAGDPSVSVAVSVAGVTDSVIATEENRAAVEKAGYTLLLDLTGKDDNWLRSSEYWDRLSRSAAFEQPDSMAPKLVDYAVMAGAYFNFYDGNNPAAHKKMYKFLDEGAVIFGYNNSLGEYETVKSFSEMNLQMVPADHAYNLSTLSGFRMASAEQGGGGAAAEESDPEQVHTLCIVMSDGDNLQWVLNNFATGSEWYGNPKRGQFAMGWGISPAAIDTAAPMLSWLYGEQKASDEFIMQLSGLGYTFPSRWKADARQSMAEKLAQSMKRSGLRYAEILDDNGFRAESLGDFAAQDGIDGLFYIEYSGYASLDGQILWLDGKPVVSARYMIWADHAGGGLGYIARKINRASRDPKSEDAYSFLIVHAWSGMKDGKLAPHGNTMDAVAELISELDGDVEVVTPSVFMDRLIRNCG